MITLDDIEINTIFTPADGCGVIYKKGSSGTYGKDGYTVCYPKMGGVFQTKERFEIKIPNKTPINVSHD